MRWTPRITSEPRSRGGRFQRMFYARVEGAAVVSPGSLWSFSPLRMEMPCLRGSDWNSSQCDKIFRIMAINSRTERAVKMSVQGGDPGARKTAGASSSRKVLRLLFAFSERRQEATVAELAEIIGVPVPTAYRHVALLKELQLLEEGKAGRYRPTARVMPLARAAQLSNDLAQIARPIVATAAEQLRETVMLMQYFGDAVVCVELTECDRPMRFTFQQGHSMPLGVGASGKMVLACLPPATQQARLGEIQASGRLRREIDQASAKQFATSLAELDEGLWACSVPVLPQSNKPVVLTLAGPAARISEASKEVTLDVLWKSAIQIREELERYKL